MWEKVGVVRDEAGLAAALASSTRSPRPTRRRRGRRGTSSAWPGSSTAAALARRESRGGHYRVGLPAARSRLAAPPDLTAAPTADVLGSPTLEETRAVPLRPPPGARA